VYKLIAKPKSQPRLPQWRRCRQTNLKHEVDIALVVDNRHRATSRRFFVFSEDMDVRWVRQRLDDDGRELRQCLSRDVIHAADVDCKMMTTQKLTERPFETKFILAARNRYHDLSQEIEMNSWKYTRTIMATWNLVVSENASL